MAILIGEARADVIWGYVGSTRKPALRWMMLGVGMKKNKNVKRMPERMQLSSE